MDEAKARVFFTLLLQLARHSSKEPHSAEGRTSPSVLLYREAKGERRGQVEDFGSVESRALSRKGAVALRVAALPLQKGKPRALAARSAWLPSVERFKYKANQRSFDLYFQIYLRFSAPPLFKNLMKNEDRQEVCM